MATPGAQADHLPPESLDQVKVLIRKHPILATCAVLAIVPAARTSRTTKRGSASSRTCSAG